MKFSLNVKPIIILGLIILMVILLALNNFFYDFESSKFNNIVTPFATIIAAIIYYLTLKEIINTNKISKIDIHYNIIQDLAY